MKRSFPGLLLLSMICLCSPPALHAENEPVGISLEEAITLALRESQNLRNKRYSLEMAEIQRKLALQSYLPTFSFSFSGLNSINYGSADSGNASLNLSLSQPVFQGGRVSTARRTQTIEMKKQRMEIDRISDELRVSCYSAYYAYLIQQKKITHQQEILEIAGRQFEISKTEFALGRLRELDLLKTELEVRAMEQGLETQKIALGEAAYKLKRILGMQTDTKFSLTGEIPSEYSGVVIGPQTDALTSMAVESNPGILTGLQKLERANLEYRAARYSWLPNLTLDATISFTGNGLPLQQVDYSLKLKVEVPLPWLPINGSASYTTSPERTQSSSFQSGMKGPEGTGYSISVETAALKLSNALEEFDTLREDLRFEVESVVERYKGLRASLEMSRAQVQLLKRHIEILETQVDLGTSTRLDFVSAQNDYIEKYLGLLEATLELLLTERSLEQLLGLPFGSLDTLGQAS